MENAVCVKFNRLKENVNLPEKKTPGAGAYDIQAAPESSLTINPGERASIPTGLQVAIPEGFILSVRPRSGLAIKEGLTMINAPGTIDSDFRGEIQILAVNLGQKPVQVLPGDRIAQLVLERSYEILWEEGVLEETQRGENGFGSTGKNG